MTGYEYNGTTGTLPFFRNIGPWIGVAGWPLPAPGFVEMIFKYFFFILN